MQGHNQVEILNLDHKYIDDKQLHSLWIELRICMVSFLIDCINHVYKALSWIFIRSIEFQQYIIKSPQHFKDIWILLEFILKILSWSISNECRYGQVIHYHTITRSILGRWRDGAMTKTRWNDSALAKVQGHDDYGAMVWWRPRDIFLHHCYRIFSASSLNHAINFLHMRYLNKMATELHYSLQLLWLIYYHACKY